MIKFKERVVDNSKVEKRLIYLTNACQKKLALSQYFAPLLLNKWSNLISIALSNGGVICISKPYEFLSRKGVYLIINIIKSESFKDVKFAATQ